MYNRISFILFVSIIILTGCKKDDIEFNAIPSISFVSISPAVASQYTSPVVITIHYEDGDGDLGENKDGVKNCYVTDNRIGITYSFRIGQLAPDGAFIPIAGNLNVDIGGQILTDSTNQQSVTYTLYIVDRAGHASNRITTNAIEIRK
jgi:hypothetical protein